MSDPIFRPSQAQKDSARLSDFLGQVRDQHGATLETYDELQRWSIDNIDLFWRQVWRYCEIIGEPGERTLVRGHDMQGAQFFPDAKLNFAENLLRRRDDADALVFRGEDKAQYLVTWTELHCLVSLMAQALQDQGIGPGDRVAAIMPNIPETVVAMLATASLGAVWSSCSPDFGKQAVLDRFGQIKPSVLIACDGYFYAGKTLDILPKVQDVADQLPSVRRVVVVPYQRIASLDEPTAAGIDKAVLFRDFLDGFEAGEISFHRVSFNDPLYILFSSGTTGVPKCIVHSVGGVLIQHLKEHQLHSDLRPNDRLFYFTTCTWMMWNWLVSGLASEATLLLYDGSPFHPDGNVLFDFAQEEGMTHFGTSAKYIETLKRRDIRPKETHDLSRLRYMMSTGSPLLPESFDFVYESVKSDLYLASIAGGTDIVSCFVCGSPISDVYRGEIPCASLGMAVDIWNDAGEPIVEEKGELVCTEPFPSMPIRFWGDDSGERYKESYFVQFPGVWAHGDFAERTKSNGFIIHGRSDATLNPGGVRIGTAEIYRQVEHIDDVVDSVVIGQSWGGDVRVVLFVVLGEGKELTDELVRQIRAQVRAGASPRHVPRKIIQVSDVPRTKSGKITELAVRDVVEGREIKNAGALANPEALEQYRNIAELTR